MLIIGAGGQAKDLLFVIHELNIQERIHFYDDVSDPEKLDLAKCFPMIRSQDEAAEYLQQINHAFILGIGNPALRKKMYDRFTSMGGQVHGLISPRAVIGNFNTQIGEGSTVMPQALVSNATRIGKGCLIHHYARVSHDCVLGDFCQLSPAALLLGGVEVGDGTHIGGNATILPGIRIGSHCVIGAGAVVTKNVASGQIVAGNPARIIGTNN